MPDAHAKWHMEALFLVNAGFCDPAWHKRFCESAWKCRVNKLSVISWWTMRVPRHLEAWRRSCNFLLRCFLNSWSSINQHTIGRVSAWLILEHHYVLFGAEYHGALWYHWYPSGTATPACVASWASHSWLTKWLLHASHNSFHFFFKKKKKTSEKSKKKNWHELASSRKYLSNF